MMHTIMITFLACNTPDLTLCSTVIFTEEYFLGKDEHVDEFCIHRAPFEAQRFLDVAIGYKAEEYFIPLVACEVPE